jgi:hypothetical protein
MRLPSAFFVLLMACDHADPGFPDQQVGYRDGVEEGESNSGERGNVKISEVLWSGSVTNEGTWDVTDIFIELRNEGARPLNLTGWRIQLSGTADREWRIPQTDFDLLVGEHRFIATKDSGCFPDPDWIIPDLAIPYGDPFRLTLRDRDERLMEPAGNREQPPYGGGYDLVVSRSMEKVELMFGGRGTSPHSWHYYTPGEVDVPNNDRVADGCRLKTLASPGRANSADYSGAYASGSFE